VALIVCLSLLGKMAFAQDLAGPPRVSSYVAENLVGELLYLQEETVVTAIRKEQPISQAPSNMYVLTDEDIRHSGATDLPTVLRRVPGLDWE